MKGLERQLGVLHGEHQNLLQSYSQKAEEVSRLNAQIAELSKEIDGLRSSCNVGFSQILMPDSFDAVPGSDLHLSGPEDDVVENAVDLTPDVAIALEDSSKPVPSSSLSPVWGPGSLCWNT
jgi:hypothetical protein